MVDLIRLTEKRPDREISAAIKTVIADAERLWAPLRFEGEFPESGIGIAKLKPKDVAVTNQAAAALQGSVASSVVWGVISISSASTWQTWIDLKIDDRIYVLVTGIQYLEADPQITAIQPTINGKTYPIIDITELQTWDLARAFFSKPLPAVRPGNQLKIEIVAKAAKSAPERIGLLGFTIGKATYLQSQ